MRSHPRRFARLIPAARRVCCALLALGLAGTAAHAQQLIYEPKNPAFGGLPSNYVWMMQSADAQKDYEPERGGPRDPLAEFEQNLQRQLLNAISRELVAAQLGGVDFAAGGLFNLGDFLVDVIPDADGLSIRVFNAVTGDETIINIPNP
jgi:curli production assembly/transport component CsgF